MRLQIRMVCDGGAYGMSTEGVMRKAAILAAGPYAIPHVKVDTYGVYTNNTPSGAFRSFGALQAQFATETHLDICAEKLGLDPFEIRRINAMRDGAAHAHQAAARIGEPRAGPRRCRAGLRAGRPALPSCGVPRGATSAATACARRARSAPASRPRPGKPRSEVA